MEVTLGFMGIIFAIGVVLSHNPMRAVIFMGAFSITMATYYYAMGAPDVAMAEATLGAVFTTFIYVVAMKHRGSIKVAYIRKEPFFFKTNNGFAGSEYHLLKRFADKNAMHLEITRIAEIPSHKDLQTDRSFQFDIICGGLKDSLSLPGYTPLPYHLRGFAIYVKTDSEDIYESLEDFLVGDVNEEY